MLMSMITTLLLGAVSLTQMNFSDSIVTCVNVMNCWLIPRPVNCTNQIAGAIRACEQIKFVR